MKFKLYAVYAGQEIVYIDLIEDTVEAWHEAWDRHNEGFKDKEHPNYMYEVMREHKAEGHTISMQPLRLLEYLPDWKNNTKDDLERIRKILIYTILPIGNWDEYHKDEELMYEEMLD